MNYKLTRQEETRKKQPQKNKNKTAQKQRNKEIKRKLIKESAMQCKQKILSPP